MARPTEGNLEYHHVPRSIPRRYDRRSRLIVVILVGGAEFTTVAGPPREICFRVTCYTPRTEGAAMLPLPADSQTEVEGQGKQLAVEIGAPPTLQALSEVGREVAGIACLPVVQHAQGGVQLRIFCQLPCDSGLGVVAVVALSGHL